MNEKALREEIGSLIRQMEEINDLAAEEDRALTQEEEDRYSDLEQTLEVKEKQLDRFMRNEKRKEKYRKTANSAVSSLVPETDEFTEEERGNLDVEVGEDRAPDWMRRTVRYFNALVTKKDDEQAGNNMIRTLSREVKNMPDSQRRAEEKEAANIIDSAPLDKIKRHVMKTALGIESRLHTTSTDDTAKAGYLLPKPFLAEIFVIVEQYSVVRNAFRTIPMTSKDLDLKNVSTKVIAYWTSEGNNIQASDLVFGEGVLSNDKLAGITSWSAELEEDMAISLLPIVEDLFGESIAEKEDQAGLLGDGTSSFGGFTGIANLDSAEETTFEAGETDASALSESYIRAAKNSLSEARQRGAAWIMHRTIKDAVEQFENTAGYRIFQENISGEGPDSLLGLPIITSEVMPSFTGAGADEPIILLGNYNRALMGMRRGLTADISREAVLQDAQGDIVYNAFQGDGALLRITERVGFKVPSAYEDAFAVVKTAAT